MYLQSKLIHFIENLQVERKLRLCQEFLDVFGRVDPGQFSIACKNSTPTVCRADKKGYLQQKLIHFIENLQVERKLRLCQEFLDVFGRVDPGQATDWWAVTQLEAIGAKSVLLQRDLESGKIPASAFKEALIGRVKSVVKFPFFSNSKFNLQGALAL